MDSITKRNNKLFLAASFIAVFVLFYLLERFSPFINDDLMYSFVCGKRPITPVQSFADAIESQLYAYQHQNGRFIVHTLVQWFCGLKLITAYRLLSSFMFAMLWFGLLKLIRQNDGLLKSDSIIVLLALFLGVPAIGVTFLGNIACGINYLWTSAVIVWLLVLFRYLKGHPAKRPLWLNMLVFAAGMFSCALQESFSIPLAGGMFLYFCFNRQEFRGSLRYLFFGIALGTCLVTIAPSNFSRAANAQGADGSFIKVLPVRVYYMLRGCIITDVLVLSLLIGLRNKERCVEFLKGHSLLIAANAISILFMLLVAYNGAQQATCLELFSFILLYNLFCTYFPAWHARKSRAIAWICLASLVPLYAYAYATRQRTAQAYEELCLSARNSKDGCAIGVDYQQCCQNQGVLFQRFNRAESFMSAASNYNKTWLSAVITEGRDTAFVRCILPLPKQDIIKGCNRQNEVSNCVYSLPQLKELAVYVVRLPIGKDPEAFRVLVRRPFPLNMLCRIAGQPDWKDIGASHTDYQYFVAGDFRYYFIRKDATAPVVQVGVEL